MSEVKILWKGFVGDSYNEEFDHFYVYQTSEGAVYLDMLFSNSEEVSEEFCIYSYQQDIYNKILLSTREMRSWLEDEELKEILPSEWKNRIQEQLALDNL